MLRIYNKIEKYYSGNRDRFAANDYHNFKRGRLKRLCVKRNWYFLIVQKPRVRDGSENAFSLASAKEKALKRTARPERSIALAWVRGARPYLLRRD